MLLRLRSLVLRQPAAALSSSVNRHRGLHGGKTPRFAPECHFTSSDSPSQSSSIFNAIRDDLTLVKFIREKGGRAQVDAVDKDGLTPLMHCSLNGQLGQMKILVSAGANLAKEDPYGRTALTFAAISNKRRAIALLLDAGAEPMQQDHDLYYAWDLTSDPKCDALLNHTGLSHSPSERSDFATTMTINAADDANTDDANTNTNTNTSRAAIHTNGTSSCKVRAAESFAASSPRLPEFTEGIASGSGDGSGDGIGSAHTRTHDSPPWGWGFRESSMAMAGVDSQIGRDDVGDACDVPGLEERGFVFESMDDFESRVSSGRSPARDDGVSDFSESNRDDGSTWAGVSGVVSDGFTGGGSFAGPAATAASASYAATNAANTANNVRVFITTQDGRVISDCVDWAEMARTDPRWAAIRQDEDPLLHSADPLAPSLSRAPSEQSKGAASEAAAKRATLSASTASEMTAIDDSPVVLPLVAVHDLLYPNKEDSTRGAGAGASEQLTVGSIKAGMEKRERARKQSEREEDFGSSLESP